MTARIAMAALTGTFADSVASAVAVDMASDPSYAQSAAHARMDA